MEKINEVSEALKELLKEAGVRQPSDLIGKVIIIKLDYGKKGAGVIFHEITKFCIIADSQNLLKKLIIKLSGSSYFSLGYDQENKFWQYRERNINLDDFRGKWPAEISFPKKWWQIF